jgi:hypothetical protein
VDTAVANVSSFLVVFLYPVISGPVAALVLVMALKRRERWPGLFFFPLLVVAHIAGYLVMVHTLGDYRAVTGTLACVTAPILAVGTALGLRLASRRFYQAVGDDPSRRRCFVIGTFLIPLLQVGTVGALALLAPSL